MTFQLWFLFNFLHKVEFFYLILHCMLYVVPRKLRKFWKIFGKLLILFTFILFLSTVFVGIFQIHNTLSRNWRMTPARPIIKMFWGATDLHHRVTFAFFFISWSVFQKSGMDFRRESLTLRALSYSLFDIRNKIL